MITEAEIYWISGLLEGEGSFAYSKGTQCVALRMSDEDVIIKYAKIIERLVGSYPHIGCSVYGGNRSDIYYTMITGERARIIMRTIVKHMGYRRRAKIWQCLNKYGITQVKPDYIDMKRSILERRMIA